MILIYTYNNKISLFCVKGIMLILGKYGIMDILMRVHILVEVFMIVFIFLFHTGAMNILVD